MKIKNFLQRYGMLIAFCIWVVIWGIAFTKANHPIEDYYVSVGVLFGWLWGLLFGAEFLNWGRPYNIEGEQDE